MTNPYRDLPDQQFWRRAVSGVELHRFDPMSGARFRIAPTDRVATAGSCFAQNIARKLIELGFNYFVPENGKLLGRSERRRRNYGVFSARYGNIYTVAQLRQLFDETFRRRPAAASVLARPDGRLVDPVRQQVEPDGFADAQALAEDRAAHLASVRSVFRKADIFILTLGLTEAWRSREDGSIFSVAPGVVGGSYDPALHEFVNFGVADVQADLFAFLDGLKKFNPGIKVVLTVSPVPLVATYEPRNVLVSTTYSKSVLRVAAEAAIARYDWVDYFPSYEIITANISAGRYYEEDFREINRLGVAHAMRCFVANFIEGRPAVAAAPMSSPAIAGLNSDIVCDEAVLDAVRF